MLVIIYLQEVFVDTVRTNKLSRSGAITRNTRGKSLAYGRLEAGTIRDMNEICLPINGCVVGLECSICTCRI